jgi:transcriptional regulator with XRE-family HTH domain
MESTFSQRLALARTYRRMTQAQLAEKAGMHRAYVSDLERGHKTGTRPRGTTIDKLAAALEVNPGWLATGYGEMLDG